MKVVKCENYLFKMNLDYVILPVRRRNVVVVVVVAAAVVAV